MKSINDLDIEQRYTPAERQMLIYRYLLKNTSKCHTVTRQQIMDHLDSFGISISLNTFYSDIDALKLMMKAEIEFDPHVHNKGAGGYWMKNPYFEPYELRLLVDGIQSLKFITQEKAQELTNRIKEQFADIYTKNTLNRQAFVSERARSMNNSVVKEADRIHEAIAEDRKISFQYFHYTPHKDRPKNYSKKGEKYIVSPFALSWNNGNYYLYAHDGQKFRYFRVDRMDRISDPLQDRRDHTDEYNARHLTHPKVKVFDMYSGEEYTVRLRVHNRLADAVIDKFGKDIMMIPHDKDHFTVSVPVEISPPFFAWIATFGRSMKILGPDPVVEKMKEFLNKAAEMYKDEGEK